MTEPRAIERAVKYVLTHEDVFLNTSSDATLLPLIFESARGDLTRPSDADLEDDRDEFGIAPLFDGRDLERI